MISRRNRRLFSSLLRHGLIDGAQREAALAHHDAATLIDLPGLAHALAWMLLRDLTSEDALRRNAPSVDRRVPMPTTDPQALHQIIDGAAGLVRLTEQGVTREALLHLFDDPVIGRLIDSVQGHKALAQAPIGAPQSPLPSAALAFMVSSAVLSYDDLSAIAAAVDREPDSAASRERTELIVEACGLLDWVNGAEAESQAQPEPSFTEEVLASWNGLRWRTKLATLGVALFGFWYFVMPDRPPAKGRLHGVPEPTFNAGPIGMSALNAAFQQGMVELRRVPASAPAWKQGRDARNLEMGMRPTPDLPPSDDVNLAGDCRAIEAGQRYACPLSIRHRGLMTTTLGIDGRMLVQGEFSFVRGESGQWRVSDDFRNEFTAAAIRPTTDRWQAVRAKAAEENQTPEAPVDKQTAAKTDP